MPHQARPAASPARPLPHGMPCPAPSGPSLRPQPTPLSAVGHASWPPANLVSTKTGSASTVTNGASVHQHGPPAAVHHDTQAGGPSSFVVGAIVHVLGNLTAPTNDPNTTKITKTSATRTTSGRPTIGIRNDGQQPCRRNCRRGQGCSVPVRVARPTPPTRTPSRWWGHGWPGCDRSSTTSSSRCCVCWPTGAARSARTTPGWSPSYITCCWNSFLAARRKTYPQHRRKHCWRRCVPGMPRARPAGAWQRNSSPTSSASTRGRRRLTRSCASSSKRPARPC